MSALISEDDLHAYADGCIDAERVTQVEAWLAAHPDHRAQVEQWRACSGILHRAYDCVLDEPVPARLIPAANRARWLNAAKVAAIAWLTLGVVAGYFLRGVVPGQTLPAEASLPHMAALAHAVFTPEVRHPVEVGADQEAHLVTWLSKRLGAPIKAPQLESVGYRLIGGRLLPGDTGEVAQFMYENAAHRRLTLYLSPSARVSGDTGFRYAREDNIDVFYWIDGNFGYALSGDVGREQMLSLATLIYQQHVKKSDGHP